MGTQRTKILAAFLAGMICTLGVLIARDYVAVINMRLDRIELYLAGQEIQRQMMQPQEQSAPQRESHKGELSKPERWKV